MNRRRRRHKPTCRHCARVRLLGHDFQCWRAHWDATLEAATAGYTDEISRFVSPYNPPPTFREYLESMAGSGWPMSGQAPRRWAA